MLKKHVEVISWWHSGRNYQSGLSLLNLYTKNQVLLRSLMRKSPKFGQHKLEYELTKSVGLDFKNMPEMDNNVTMDENEDPENITPVIPFVPPSVQFPDSVPGVIAKITKALSSLYKDRSFLHKKLHDTGTVNNEQQTTLRSFIANQISRVSESIDYLFGFVHRYKDKKQLPPKDADLTPYKYSLSPQPKQKETLQPLELPSTGPELKKLKKHLQVLNSKDRNRLKYQKPVKQFEENPIPKGPKRIIVINRVEFRNIEITRINEKLAKLNS